MVINRSTKNYHKLSIRVPVGVYKLLKVMAKKEKRSLNSQLLCLLEAGIHRQEAQKGEDGER